MLREVIQLGHRTTGWSVDYSSDNSTFTSLLTGKQSIGYKWLEKFNAVTARYVRLKITKGQASVALNTFGVYKKTFVRSNYMVGTVAPVAQPIAAASAAIPVFGRMVQLPQSFAGRSFTAELVDLQGRSVAAMSVNPKLTQTGIRVPTVGAGLYLIKCTMGNDVVVRKLAIAAK